MVVEGFGSAGPEDVTDGAGGHTAEMALYEDLACGGEDEKGLDHRVLKIKLNCNNYNRSGSIRIIIYLL